MIIDVRRRICGCGHTGGVHKPTQMGSLLYGGLGRCALATCDCRAFRVHEASRYGLVWHECRERARYRYRGSEGYVQGQFIGSLPTVSKEALPHSRFGLLPDTWAGGPGHQIGDDFVGIDGCCNGRAFHYLGRRDVPGVDELKPLLEWTKANTKAADLLELVPVPPLVDEKLPPSPETVRIGSHGSTVMVTEDAAGDEGQIGDRYVLKLREMRLGVHVFARPTTLILPGEDGEETEQLVDVPHVYVAMEHPRRHQVVTVAADESSEHWIDGSGEDAGQG